MATIVEKQVLLGVKTLTQVQAKPGYQDSFLQYGKILHDGIQITF
jgi:hypothetical protein